MFSGCPSVDSRTTLGERLTMGTGFRATVEKEGLKEILGISLEVAPMPRQTRPVGKERTPRSYASRI